MFERDHHIRIASVLQALSPEFLVNCGCLFGSGTVIVLSRSEYRESVDIDLLVSDQKGYRTLTQAVTGEALAREIRADQYGIRTLLRVGDSEIKFEIVLEGRLAFEAPGAVDRICGVATLTPLDMAASILLANSDRWPDDSVFSRDLIALAMLELPRNCWSKRSRKRWRACPKLFCGNGFES